MAIDVRCPDCGDDYHLDNSLGGKFVTCECGLKFQLPRLPDMRKDYSCCPSCLIAAPAKAVICPGCGYNFRTRMKLAEQHPPAPAEQSGAEEPAFTFQAAKRPEPRPAADEDASPGFLARYGGLIKPALLLLLVLGAGLGGYVYFTTKAYGISSKAPLGTLAKLEQEFLGMGLVKDSKVADIPKDFGAAGKIHRYDDNDLLKKTRNSIDESVYVAVDAEGKVRAVGGNFYTPDSSIPGTGTRISRFFVYYLDELGLPDPEFKTERHQDGLMKWSEDIGAIKTEVLDMLWVKGESPMPLYASSDDIKLCLKGHSVKSLGKGADLEKP